jgi:hypothetical protein
MVEKTDEFPEVAAAPPAPTVTVREVLTVELNVVDVK